MLRRYDCAIKELAKASAGNLGIGDELRRAAVIMAVASERARFSLTGRPEPSSSVVVAGSGRSGTTWLADLLAANLRAQKIREPLSPWRGPARDKMIEWYASKPSVPCLYLDAEGVYPEWESFLRQVLCGEVRSGWTDFGRTCLFPSRYMVKMVCANLMLGYLYDKFRPRIVYLVRHPCAVIHSRMAIGWQADVRDILRQEKLVEAHLKPWVEEIEKERDLLGAHAVWWAVENFVAGQELATRPHYRVVYEELCLDPEKEISKICSWLGVEMRPDLDHLIERPSRSARSKVEGIGARERLKEKRLSGDRLLEWKEQFTREEEQRIRGWAERFSISYYDERLTEEAT